MNSDVEEAKEEEAMEESPTTTVQTCPEATPTAVSVSGDREEGEGLNEATPTDDVEPSPVTVSGNKGKKVREVVEGERERPAFVRQG